MINKDKFVPDKKIAYLSSNIDYTNEIYPIKNMIAPAAIKRDWFHPYFYNCLPITMANSYGFSLICNVDVSLYWENENSYVEIVNPVNDLYTKVRSGVAPGCITIDFPFSLRTSPGVNLIITSPFNSFINNITTVSSVIEADNLRRNFSTVLKVENPGHAEIKAGTTIATVIPIPRYYVDQFELIDAELIFSEEDINEEENALYDFKNYKELKLSVNKNSQIEQMNGKYLKGYDLYGNKFLDHQKNYGQTK